jgi:hypothetical protein
MLRVECHLNLKPPRWHRETVGIVKPLHVIKELETMDSAVANRPSVDGRSGRSRTGFVESTEERSRSISGLGWKTE